jgi:hypothetical protein
MKREKAKFSWVTFGITLPASLAVGGLIVAYVSSVLLELIKNIIVLICISLLVSVLFGYSRFIRNALDKVWILIAKQVSLRYIEKRMKEYSSKIRILGLKNNSGTVNLILEAGINDGVSPGMVLDVLTEPGEEKYGEVQVIQLDNGRCIVSPTNRINPKFWETLEDRMNTDPSPPPNIVAKFYVPHGLLETLEILRSKEKRHGY